MRSRFRRPGGHCSGRRADLAVLPVLPVLFLILLLSAGCARRQAAESIAAAAGNPRRSSGAVAAAGNLVDTSAIERSPAYRQAVLCFSGKDYRGALARIESLLETPDLSPSAQTFLHRQQVLCQDALSGRKAATAPATATASAAASGTRPVRSAADGDTQPRTRADCGPRALRLVCRELKVPSTLEALRQAAGTTADGTTMAGLTKAAQSVGLKAEGVQMDRNALSNLSKPAIAWTDGNHYIAVLSVHHSLMDPSVNGDAATVHDPNKPGEEEMPLAGPTGLLARSGGMLLLLSRENWIASAAVPTH